MSKPRILVVDDDPGMAMTVVMALEAEGYPVTETSSAESAIEILNNDSFPIVVSDIYMSQKTGLDVLHRAKALNPAGAVILMSGKGSIETVVEATRGGAFEYLSKPFTVDRLLEAVRGAETALKQSRSPVSEPGYFNWIRCPSWWVILL